MMYYVHGLNWEAYYKPDGYRPSEREFETKEDAQAYCDRMTEEHPESRWSVSETSLYSR